MGTIVPRKRKDGSIGYTAQIRLKVKGKVVHTEAKTFDREPAASAWIKKRERELSQPGAIEGAKREDPTLGEVIARYIREDMRDLKRQGALINFEVYPDPELNTASQLEDGKVYWNIRFTDVPPAENPIFRFEVTNQWMTEVLDNQI
ncbi:phage tail sheath C-terminal domain-containing protein [Burkholderia gladioli]|uniref:phage tail sheath C-terminal domain-containing protein n=1 Tax=Burkholderia gladioli TaxID=28095 RepID=UPI0024462B1A|nr:phage tail sheath C-terminal domain-containing protein [Burkholderia gladioli]